MRFLLCLGFLVGNLSASEPELPTKRRARGVTEPAASHKSADAVARNVARKASRSTAQVQTNPRIPEGRRPPTPKSCRPAFLFM